MAFGVAASTAGELVVFAGEGIASGGMWLLSLT